MLYGTAPIDPISRRAPTVERLDTEPLELPAVEVLRVTCEIARREIETFLPPALQATSPPVVTWALHRCSEGPLGPFALAEAQLHCRSGARTRTYLLGGVIDSARAGTELASRWGFDPRIGEIELFRGFDRVDARVEVEGRTILEASLRNPLPLGSGAIHFAPSMHAAHTSKGLRLLQVDAAYDISRSERGTASIGRLDAAAWNEARLQPTHPVAATFSVASLTLKRLRFTSRPEVSAFEGTEAVG